MTSKNLDEFPGGDACTCYVRMDGTVGGAPCQACCDAIYLQSLPSPEEQARMERKSCREQARMGRILRRAGHRGTL